MGLEDDTRGGGAVVLRSVWRMVLELERLWIWEFIVEVVVIVFEKIEVSNYLFGIWSR